MRLFAIADLHLPGGNDKPMDVFGSQWDHHFEHIAEDWSARVGADDAVLIPGDISWAMHLEHALPDLQQIGALPGRKVILRGNHDYWWSSITRVRQLLPEGMMALQNDAIDLGELVVCGTRGWMLGTESEPLGEADRKIFQRELLRLRMSLEAAVRLAKGRPIVVMLHYPPLFETTRHTPVTELLMSYPVHAVVYGHLHGAGIRAGFSGVEEGLSYHLVSCDALHFALKEIPLPVREVAQQTD